MARWALRSDEPILLISEIPKPRAYAVNAKAVSRERSGTVGESK